MTPTERFIYSLQWSLTIPTLPWHRKILKSIDAVIMVRKAQLLAKGLLTYSTQKGGECGVQIAYNIAL